MASLTEQIAGYRRDIQKYQALKSQLSTVIAKLNSAVSSVGSLDYEIKSCFRIDNSDTALAIKTARSRDNIDKTIGFLNRTVLPAIDAAMGYSNRQIANLELEVKRRAAEEARRRAAEEERKRQAEASNNQERITA